MDTSFYGNVENKTPSKMKHFLWQYPLRCVATIDMLTNRHLDTDMSYPGYGGQWSRLTIIFLMLLILADLDFMWDYSSLPNYFLSSTGQRKLWVGRKL